MIPFFVANDILIHVMFSMYFLILSIALFSIWQMRILVRPCRSPICCKVLGPSLAASNVQLLYFLQLIQCLQALKRQLVLEFLCLLKHVLFFKFSIKLTSFYYLNNKRRNVLLLWGKI